MDAAQQQPKVMQQAMVRAAYAISDAVDQYVGGFYTDVSSGNTIAQATPAVGIDANIGTTMYDYIVKLGTYLTQSSVPKVGRWCVIDPWMTEMLLQDKRFSNYGTDASRQTILTGKLDATGGMAVDSYLGRLNGMDVYESNNVPVTSGTKGQASSIYQVLAGHSMGITFAEGVTKTEAYRPPLRFADAVKGLHLYGAKVTRPYALACFIAEHP